MILLQRLGPVLARGRRVVVIWTSGPRSRRRRVRSVDGRRVGRHFGSGQTPILVDFTTKVVDDPLKLFLIWLKENIVTLKTGNKNMN
jgi:hypothetical protein